MTPRPLLSSLTVRGALAVAAGLAGLAAVGALRRFLGDDALSAEAAAGLRYGLQGAIAVGTGAFGVGIRRALK